MPTRLILACFLSALLYSHTAFAEKRVALVIGNSKYQHSTPLANPINDARAISRSLRRLGFVVVEATDVTNRKLSDVLSDFLEKLHDAEVGLFFYAGHGISFKGENYIVPVDATLKNQFSVRQETVSINFVLSEMASVSRVNLVFLDACRDNPLAKKLKRSLSRSASVGRGLSLIKPPEDKESLIVFATEPGEVASDGDKRHSPFTKALLDHIERPGIDIEVMLKAVQRDVRKATRNKQRPERVSKLESNFSFNPTSTSSNTASSDKEWERERERIRLQREEREQEERRRAALEKQREAERTRRDEERVRQARETAERQAEQSLWDSVKNESDADMYKLYLQQYPNGRYAAIARLKVSKLATRSIPDTHTTNTYESVSPSFNCSGRKTPTEHAICNNNTLAKLDNQMSEMFFRAKGRLFKSQAKRLTREQRGWIKRRDNCGSNSYCIEQSYRQRIHRLQQWGG